MPLLAENLDAVILAGGLGTRLMAKISGTPKVLAPVSDRVFLDILVASLIVHGFRRFIFCVGYLGEQIIGHFQSREDCRAVFSVEETPLGTGGAIKNAIGKVNSEMLLVLNGDSFCALNYGEFFVFHEAKKAVISIAVSELEETGEYGSITLDQDCRIVSFDEKTRAAHASSIISAGIYLFGRDAMDALSAFPRVFSLERDFFPTMVKTHPCYGYRASGKLWDIGTPERYGAFCEAYGEGGGDGLLRG